MSDDMRMVLSDPTGQIESECADKRLKQADVASTYGLAIRDEHLQPVDWARVNAAIRNRWPRGLVRVKMLAWKKLEAWEKASRDEYPPDEAPTSTQPPQKSPPGER